MSTAGFGATDTTATVAPSVPSPASASRVGIIQVFGNVFADSARIVRSFEVIPGSVFSDEMVRRGIRKLFALGIFDNVTANRREHDGVVDILLSVIERPRISTIEFTGNRKKETSDLQKKLFLRSGDTYAPLPVKNQEDSLRIFYRDAGYANAVVEAQADSVRGANQVKLRFVIQEGDKVKIREVGFVGAKAFSAKKLRKQLKTKAKGFFGGGDVKEERFDLDREKLEAFYHNHGYRDARMTGHELIPQADPRRLTYRVTVDEGPFYYVGKVAWAGTQIVPVADLDKLWDVRTGGRYDASRIERAQGEAYALYADKGYLYLNIEPNETVRDSIVDVTFRVVEGQPSNIRYVNISGNKGTREKVLRREVSVREGERFRRASLLRTKDDLSRLGLFEDIQMDFAPAESTDVDINIKVKEKQVGTASAGAGYTNEAGLTGFLELGHNNLLGNGQSVQLHLERGGRTQDYLLSFTEPWFRDTPTLLGASVYNSTRDRDLYREKRVGGSVRTGRPLPWPDFSRGSISYRLENVTLNLPGNGPITPADSVALLGIRAGRAVLTSSFETTFLRNSTNDAFYPTRGTRLSVSDEFAGGPFGGSVDFHKHRIEGRLYMPSLFKSVTTMLRMRVGLLGDYGDPKSTAPFYERFRLGGGSTIDPLRGYDDYEVVPDKFNRFVLTFTTRISQIDSISTPGMRDTVYATDTTRTHVRYPGGQFFVVYSAEQQFPIVHPLHGVLFFDAGNTWDLAHEIRPFDLKLSVGIGFRVSIPILGNIGFDWGYGFNRDDGARAVGHFLIGNVNQ